MRDSWAMIKGDSDFTTFVADPFDSSSSSSVVAVEYPEGSYAGDGPAGGFMGGIMSVFGEDTGVQRALLSYEVRRGFTSAELSRAAANGYWPLLLAGGFQSRIRLGGRWEAAGVVWRESRRCECFGATAAELPRRC